MVLPVRTPDERCTVALDHEAECGTSDKSLPATRGVWLDRDLKIQLEAIVRLSRKMRNRRAARLS